MSKKKIFIFGAGSAGKDLLRLISDINEKSRAWEVMGFVDSDPKLVGKKINGYKILRHQDLPKSKNYYGVCGILDPNLKKKIVTKEIRSKGYKLPVLIHPATVKSKDFIT